MVFLISLGVLAAKSGDIFDARDNADHKTESAIHGVWLGNGF